MNIALPYQSLKLNYVIDELEFPILSLYRDANENWLMRYFIDFDGSNLQSLIWRINERDIFDYLNNSLSIRSLILNDNKEFLYFLFNEIDPSTDNEVEVIPLKQIPEDYLPGHESFFGFGFPDQFDWLIPKYSSTNYVVNLKEHGIILHMRPKKGSYENTVSLADIAFLTKKVDESFSAFVDQEFYESFKNDISDIKEFEKVRKKVRSKTDPRVPDVQNGSFEFTLSIDRINQFGLSAKVRDWANNILFSYAEHVLFMDYSNEEVLKNLVNNININKLRDVYEPIINAIAQDAFFLKIRNVTNNKNIEFNKNYRSAKKKVKGKIQSELNLQADEVKNKFVHVVYAVSSAGKSSKKPRQSEMVAAFESKSYEHLFNDLIRLEAKYHLIKPIVFIVQVTDNGTFIIESEFFKKPLVIDDTSIINDQINLQINKHIDDFFNGAVLDFFKNKNISYQ